ncbi:hypothetical protein PHSY_005617 [Pseudozyma hubeiensis SY62]|uniref:Uncharacterized protein n=1 Tax=Pseudozyma hubeiensis (strain SY62) TaxID=1305764 RepID=R9P9K3_PSEHS|nr:hypothetical protein PHSY_005617 [Pseudozyma hubeiensis SY62]GAC98029.1 hypothetical protein PHSY_005617 [Pseudozyma hubeiensis SY62]
MTPRWEGTLPQSEALNAMCERMLQGRTKAANETMHGVLRKIKTCRWDGNKDRAGCRSRGGAEKRETGEWVDRRGDGRDDDEKKKKKKAIEIEMEMEMATSG